MRGEEPAAAAWDGKITIEEAWPMFKISGGILLFEKALEEDADNIYVKSDNLPVAYASNNVNSTANTARGSLNLTESQKLDNGYKFVWEFTPSQGNGTIAAVALTSAKGGENGFGSLNTGIGVFTIMEVRSGKGSDAGWGRLKSGAGWISLDYAVRI